ncbi:MAG TPA: hypothetical protein VKA46_33715 [Gemmataceae bacterium]|nr:hypothetical protein [Gemmataceae bacterium]
MRTYLLASLVGVSLLTAAARAEDDTKAILTRAIKAHGGEEARDKFKAGQTKAKGKIEILGGLEFTQEASFMLPDKFKEIVEMEVMGQKLRVVTAFNGSKGFIEANGKEVPVDDKIKDALKDAIYAMKVGQLSSLLKEKGFELSALGEVKVDGKPAVGVRVASKGHKDISLFFNKETGLLAKMEHRTVDPMSGMEITEERIVTEYGKTDGVPTPKRVLVNHDGNKYMEVEILETKRLEKLDDSEFAKP